MFIGEVSVDSNGIVLFDPSLLRARYGGSIEEGTNLFERYMTTEEGDEVLAEGLILPVLAIDDAGYQVVIRRQDESVGGDRPVIVENGVYALKVKERLVLADLAVLQEWVDELGWQYVEAPAGNYAVTVNGFRALNPGKTEITNAGYEFVLQPQESLPELTADLEANMRVLRLDI